MDRKRRKLLKQLQKKIKYRFRKLNFLDMSLTHKSYAFEHSKEKMEWNERLEFFGDSILGFIISDFLYIKFKDLQEGDLTKLKSQIVCTQALERNALRLRLGDYILLGRGEDRMGGRSQTSNLSSAMEALIGAVYLDRGIKYAKKFVLEVFKSDIQDVVNNRRKKDYKSLLQEFSLKKFGTVPSYELISQEGPEHKKEFVINAKVAGKPCGSGWGFNKKSAEQMAAKEALEKYQA